MPAPHILTCPAWQSPAQSMDWLVHGSTTRSGGYSTAYLTGSQHQHPELNLGFTPSDDRDTVLRNRRLLVQTLLASHGTADLVLPLITLSQIHSATIHRVTPETPQPAPGDGLITDTPGILLAIQTADCVPVLLVDPILHAVGAFHAGWRGTAEQIVEHGVARMCAEFHSDPATVLALIGPAIGACCYTVGEELHDMFTSRFSYGDALFTRDPGRQPRLDLIEANRRQLLSAGLKAEAIGRLGSCTSCHPDLYFSHRQSHGHTGRMMSVIGIRN